jgi:hypothetical protein
MPLPTSMLFTPVPKRQGFYFLETYHLAGEKYETSI